MVTSRENAARFLAMRAARDRRRAAKLADFEARVALQQAIRTCFETQRWIGHVALVELVQTIMPLVAAPTVHREVARMVVDGQLVRGAWGFSRRTR